jgi:nicotinate-nucleotide adenylyltransferase
MIIFFGGSFDPPHLGHLNIVKVLKLRFPNAYKIFIVPNSISPFKNEKSLNENILWKLCQLTFSEVTDERTELINTEMIRKEKSYTLLSIQEIKAQFPDEPIYLCLGEDSLASLESWYEFEELNSMIHSYVIIRRKTRSPLPIVFPTLEISNKSEVLDNDLWDTSSTRLRTERESSYAKHWMHPDAFSYLSKINWFDQNEIN